MLTALTELAIEHAEDQRLGFRSIGPQLFGLLREGRVEAVREALAYHPAQLPAEPFRVVALALDELAPPVRDALERIAAGRRRRLYAVEQGEEFVLLVDQSSWAAVEAELASELATGRLRVGISEEARWDALGDAVTQASKALTGAAPGQVLEFGKLMAGTVFGLLTEHRVAELALLRLGALLPTQGGVERLHEAAVWLRHNGAWDPAARELGLHRHTLKQRIAELGRELGLSFDGFQGRAELWAMLVAVDLAER
jgi:purine catabolism regulator